MADLKSLIAATLLLIAPAIALAKTYYLSVQPVLPAEQIKKNYQPLAQYLSDKTGQQISIKSYRNFVTYWIQMQKGKDMDFILDAAHFTDYRVQRKNYKVLAKFPDTVSFTVVTGEDNFVFDMDELISKRIATMVSPSIGAVQLDRMFPNPARLPFIIEASDSVDAVKKLIAGDVDAAIIPSPLVGNYSGLNTVLTTDPVPHMAMSSSPNVPEDVVTAVKQALLEANHTVDGKKMLGEMNIEYFEDADDAEYNGFAQLLDGVFGY
ncbi:MAG: phosphate/phosphite/phosphonate ABC transporter substrate-binding protein [Gammaproteobacteria bacterium]|nr:phosphate/phosphite/phosphonate ABC transporter substrate-binding protein [Gammaproteobacteria bacterium]